MNYALFRLVGFISLTLLPSAPAENNRKPIAGYSELSYSAERPFIQIWDSQGNRVAEIADDPNAVIPGRVVFGPKGPLSLSEPPVLSRAAFETNFCDLKKAALSPPPAPGAAAPRQHSGDRAPARSR